MGFTSILPGSSIVFRVGVLAQAFVSLEPVLSKRPIELKPLPQPLSILWPERAANARGLSSCTSAFV